MLASLVPCTHAGALLTPRTITAIDAPAAASDSAAVARVLDADGVVRITNALPHATEVLTLVNRTLGAALQQNHEEFGDEWQAQFGNVLSGHCRHDVKLDLSDATVRAALAALLSTIEPAIAAKLGDDALLYELAALVSLPGSRRQIVHADLPYSDESAVDDGILTAFCALQDIDASMGPTLYLPGTHTADAHAAFFTYDNFDLYVDSGDEEDEDDEEAALTEAALDALGACRATLGAGDVSLYDGRLLHAGGANRSPRQRVLFYCSFATPRWCRSTRGTLRESLRLKHALRDWREWTR